MSTKNTRDAPEQVIEMKLTELHPFKNHPFKVLDDELMQETIDSIMQVGVLSPAVVRPDPNGGYEVISGHRRLHACKAAGLDTMPVIVKELTDDEAVIFMVDSNLQRENILPSERAKAYKMKAEALKHQGQRDNSTSVQVGPKSWTAAKLGAEAGESASQVKRYIKLSELIPDLLEKVEAPSREEAMQMAEDMWNNGDIVLLPDDFLDVTYSADEGREINRHNEIDVVLVKANEYAFFSTFRYAKSHASRVRASSRCS